MPKSLVAHTLLVNTLERLEYWLERDGVSRVIVAEPSVKKVKSQRLPEHVKIIRKKRRGKRKVLRGRRHYDEQRLKLAVWEEDNLVESALPSVACCTRGSVDLNVADYVLRIEAGDWIIFPAGAPKQDGSSAHFEGNSQGRFGEVLWMYSGLTRLDGLTVWMCRSEGEKHYKPMNSIRIEDRFLARLFDEFCERMPAKPIARRLLSLVLFTIRYKVKIGEIARSVRRLSPQNRGKYSIPIAEALEYIDNNLRERLTVEKVAKQVLVSPATLARHFKEQTGETFGQYQTKRRMEMAEKLLKTTTLSINWISARIGLQYGQMRKLFLKTHGCTPSEYRKKNN